MICTFNNNKLFKKFKEKLAVTPGAITCILAYLGSWENGNCYPAYQGAVYTPPTEGVRNSNGKGVQEAAVSKGVGSDFQGFFFQGL